MSVLPFDSTPPYIDSNDSGGYGDEVLLSDEQEAELLAVARAEHRDAYAAVTLRARMVTLGTAKIVAEVRIPTHDHPLARAIYGLRDGRWICWAD